MTPGSPDSPADRRPEASSLAAGLLDAFPDMIFWLDTEGVLVGFKPGIGTGPYRPPAEFLGKRFEDVLPARVADLLLEAFRATLADGTMRTIEYALDYETGARQFECRVVRLAPSGGAAVVRDLTEARATEARAREWERRYAAAVRASGLMLFEWKPGTGGLVLGGGAGQLPGSAGDPVVGLEGWLERVVDEDRARVRGAIAEALDRGAPLKVEYRIRGRGGDPVPVRHEADLLRDEGGRVTGLIGFVSDQSVARALAEQTLRARKLEAVELMARGVAHDFNQMLTLIVNYSEFVRGSLEPGHPLLADLDILAAAGEQAALLTRQLLALSRVDVRPSGPVDLPELVRAMEASIRRLVGPRIELEVGIGAGAGAVAADRDRLEAVLLNLVVNAKDAIADRGRIMVAVRPEEAGPGAPGGTVVLEVSDDGCGISEEVRPRLFEPFFTTRRAEGRLGLGLAMVKGSVEAMGGRVEVESRPGDGTKVRLVLPRVAPAGGPGAAAAPATADGATILLVDDAPDIRLVATRALTRMGWKVLEASGAEEAARLAAQHPGPIQLLLTDVMLPGSSGVVVAARVRELRPGIRVLFTSGALDERSIPDHPEGLPGPFLPKPFTRESLDRKIREAMATGPGT